MVVKPTTADMLQYAETDLSETLLAAYIDAAEQQVTSRFGPHHEDGDQTWVVLPGAEARSLKLPYETSEITEVRYGTTAITDTLYRLLDGGLILRRTDANYWNVYGVTVVARPVNRDAIRKVVIIDLVKLRLAFEGVGSSWIDDVRVQHISQEAGAEQIMAALRERRPAVLL